MTHIHTLIKPERDPDMNPVDYWNIHGNWSDTLPSRNIVYVNDNTIINSSKKECIKLDTQLHVLAENPFKLPIGRTLTRFASLSRLKFKGNYRAAITWIEHKFLNKEIPYIRIGSDYFKLIDKPDRYGTIKKELKNWRKEEVKDDIGVMTMPFIRRYDDFILVPDNVNHSDVVGNCYNMYAPFNHKPADSTCTDQMTASLKLMRHIFGDQLRYGLQYMKVLYELPQQLLPILCLVSKERQTGKTTFLNWLDMIFGDNFVLIDPESLSSDFNSLYATKNIIALDETVIEKNHAVEKLKSIATTKSLAINQKHVSQYRVPFYGKVIINSNKETDFMRIDSEEIRFWVRKVPVIDTLQTGIEKQLREEIPYFLRHLLDIDTIDTTQSRMVFTKEQISTDHLQAVVKESRSGLYKELRILIAEWFDENETSCEFFATASDLKKTFFDKNNQISIAYLSKVLRDEFGMKQTERHRYAPIDNGSDPYAKKRNSTPYQFMRSDFVTTPVELKVVNDPF